MSKAIKIKYSILLFSILLISFIVSYHLYNNAIIKENNNQKNIKNSASVNSNNYLNSDNSKDDIVNKDTKIIFQTEYKKSGDIVDEKSKVDTAGLIGKTKKQIEEIYGDKGYIIKEMDSSHLILLKSYESYSPEKYVIDIYREGNCIAIFKTDLEGKEHIENPDSDIKFDTKISDLKEGDLETLLKGGSSLQFNTKEEAEDNYNAIFKS